MTWLRAEKGGSMLDHQAAISGNGLELFLGTLVLRPYVFLFLAAFLVVAVPAWGWRRTLLYTVLGYALAWAAEYSSIHNGFPFGLYSYISTSTRDKELWVAGVPSMDSLSFVFLTFAGLQTARLILSPPVRGPLGRWDLRWARPATPPTWTAWLLAGLLTMGLDLIIDPVALHGDRWFLGLIYSYPHGGLYFDVPLSNFAGWALVAWTITGAFLLLDRAVLRRWWGNWRGYPADALWGVGLFVGVLAFNLGATFAIGEVTLGLAGCLWSAIMLAPVAARLLGWQPLAHRERV
jgi:uncharacterized membrane protein